MDSLRFRERMIHSAATSLEAQWISPKRGKKLSSSLEPGASLREAYELQRHFASGGARLAPIPARRPRLDATAFLEARRRTWLESRQAAAALSASNPSRRRGASPREAEEEVCLADLCADPQYDAAILESIFGHDDVDRNPQAGMGPWRKASLAIVGSSRLRRLADASPLALRRASSRPAAHQHESGELKEVRADPSKATLKPPPVEPPAAKPTKKGSNTLGKIDLDEGPDAPPIQLQIAAALRQNAGKVLDLFREWDANGDGEVSKKEFRKAMPAIGLDVSVQEVDALFDSWDWDGGGALNLRELSKVLKSPPPPLAAPARALPKSSSLPSLSELPANSSLPRLGQTTSRVRMRLASELDKALPMKKAAPQMNATDLREMLAATLGSLVDGFRQFDTNGDGKVDLQEFIKGVQSMVASRGVKCSPWYIEALFDDLGERSTMIYSSIPLSSFSLHVCLSLSLVPPLFPNRLSLPCPYSITP